MSAPESPPASPPRPAPTRRRRSAPVALAIAVGLLLALYWISRPDRVAGLILGRAGTALGLDITASGASEYRLRGTPRLVLRDVVAREPGADAPLLRAERIALEVPWTTLRSGGEDLTIKRIELDAPQLDLAALQRWQAQRPPTTAPMRIPTLSDGLRIVRGSALGDGWRVEALDLDLPAFHADRRIAAHLQGRAVVGATRVPFALEAAMTRFAIGAGFGAAGNVEVATATWSLPMRVVLSGRPYDGIDGLGLDATRLAANARYRAGNDALPFVFAMAGPLRYRDGALAWAPLGLAVRGRGAIPTLGAHGALALADALRLQLDGRLAGWPQAWPALPPPIGQSRAPLPFALDYKGPADLSGPASLRLRRDAAEFDGRFRLPGLLAWVGPDSHSSPLPPLDGHVRAAALEISGARLEGIEVEFDDEDTRTQ